jgi:LuxR family transcriptional regulator, maltose regulon positive regulatory protein
MRAPRTRERQVTPSATLAKLTRPRLYGAVPRTRLFAEIDHRRRERPVIWICAPPGSGKTTLAASYLEPRETPGIWYQVDSGDADAATFFYYLGLAMQSAAPKEKKPLPLLTPEFLTDIPNFARRYFRELYSRLPQGAVLVLDNYHEVAAGSPFHQVVAEALLEIPEGLNALVLSRTEPPPSLARLSASDRLSLLDWASLRLTVEETTAITLLRHPIDEATIGQLHKQSDGWAAGLTLMLEHLKRSGVAAEAVQAETRDTVFNYFAGEIFDKAEPETQQILISTALLPRVTVFMAEKLSLQPGAGKLLDVLYRRHLFTDRRLGPEPTYHYHDLFRAFLIAKAKEVYTAAGLAQLITRAAKLLEESGQMEDAVALYLEAMDWQAATRILLDHAPALIAQGREQTLRQWIAQIPREAQANIPWLGYWQGMSLLASRPSEAMQWFEKVSNFFEHAGDRLGQVLCAAAMIHAVFLEWSDLTKMDPWIDRLKTSLEQELSFPRREAELQVYSSALIALFYRRPRDPLLPLAAARAHALLAEPLDPNVKVTAGVALLLYYLFLPGERDGESVMERIEPVLDTGLVSSLNRMYWYVRKGTYLGSRCRYDEAVASIERGEAVAREDGIGFRGVVTYMPRMSVMAQLGDIEGLKHGIACMQRVLDASRHLDIGLFNFGRANLYGVSGEFAQAARCALEGKQYQEKGGMFFAQCALTILAAAHFSLADDMPRALALLAEAKALAEHTYLVGCELDAAAIEAHVALRQGDHEQCGRLLRSVVVPRQMQDTHYFTRYIPALHAELFSEALRQGIEIDAVRALIQRRRLKPVSSDIEHWPWLVKIRAFGDFSVEASTIKPRGKPHYRLLEFMKVLIAFGGSGVNATLLSETLWPDAEGDAAQTALHTTLYRVRKLLGDDHTILLQDGKVSFNVNLCWSDVAAMQSVAQQVEKLQDHQETSVSVFGALGERLIDLYRGPLLAQEGDKPWLLGPRDRLRSQFRRLVSLVGRALQVKQDTERAITLYRKALERDNLAEDFYLQLMLCHQRRGEHAEGLNVYRRCRELLSIVLGIQPNKKTQGVYETLCDLSGR